MTRQYDDLPPVSAAPLSRIRRGFIVAEGCVIGLLAGTIAAVVALSVVPWLVKLIVSVSAEAIGDQQAGAASFDNPPWFVWLAGVVVGLLVAGIVGFEAIERRIDDAQLRVHVAMYRDVIEEHMRSEAALRAARPRGAERANRSSEPPR
ncbi:hypothetical protein [Mycolicibacterium sp.]|uniref:hypothetical protein n=1 Tax=Mycolicibacterium sp. TaxID=2320850 RepID=UPI0037C77055